MCGKIVLKNVILYKNIINIVIRTVKKSNNRHKNIKMDINYEMVVKFKNNINNK